MLSFMSAAMASPADSAVYITTGFWAEAIECT